MSQINLPLRHNASLTFKKSNILSWKLLKPYSSVLFKSQNRFTFCYALRRLLSEIFLYRSNQNDCTNQKGLPHCNFLTNIISDFLLKAPPFPFLTKPVQGFHSPGIITAPSIVHHTLIKIQQDVLSITTRQELR